MENEEIKKRYVAHYTKAVKAFINEVGDVNADGIPEIHLPLWGKQYGKVKPSIAFIGRDTWCWGGMEEFLKCARNIRAVIPMEAREVEFLSFPFKKGGTWNKKGNSIFWDMVMRLLAEFRGIKEWREIKAGKHDDRTLQTFVWANANAVEIWEAKKLEAWKKMSEGKNADRDAHRQLVAAANRHLDSFPLIQQIFRPDVAIVMSNTHHAGYWGTGAEKIPPGVRIGERKLVNYVYHSSHGTHIFHTGHPNYLRQRKGQIEEVVKTIASEWQAIQGRG